MKFLTFFFVLIGIFAINSRLTNRLKPKKENKKKHKRREHKKGFIKKLLKAGVKFVHEKFGNSTIGKVVSHVGGIALDMNNTDTNSTNSTNTTTSF
jgi:hypothetical protein